MTPVESKGQTLVDDPAARLLVKDAHSQLQDTLALIYPLALAA